MSTQLYEEAIADAKHIRHIAEDNAKLAVIAAVEPQIRKLIEHHLMEGSSGFDLGDDSLQDDDLSGAVTAATSVAPTQDTDVAVAAAITPPGLDGKVTLDLDALDACAADSEQTDSLGKPASDDEFVLNAESIAALEPVLSGVSRFTENEVELQTFRLGENVAQFSRASRTVRSSKGYRRKIEEMISRVKNTYECVQSSVRNPLTKRTLERKLEAFNRALGRLTESQTMSARRGSRVNEGDITLKLTGVPDELDLDNVGVDLIRDDGDDDGAEDSGAEDLDLDTGDESGDDNGDELDLSGGDEGEEKMGEGRRMSDNTIVEIDEGMLKREISRARRLREEAVPSVGGHAPRGSALDDFGGGKDEGDAWLDSDIPSGGTNITVVGESDGSDEVLEVDMGETDEACDDSQTVQESRAKISRERKLQERLTSRLAMLKATGRRARAAGKFAKLAETTAAFKNASKQLRDSQRRVTSIKENLAESTRPSRVGVRSNSGPRQSAESTAFRDLRGQVSQLNLRNAKLIATTKLLQNESLSSKQRANIVEQLESAKNPNEVKLVYESLMKAYGRDSKSLNENQEHKVRGSSSRVTRSTMTTLNESTEAARWAQLAGIR